MRVLILGRQFERGALELLQKDIATNLNDFGATVVLVNTNSDYPKKKYQKYEFIQKGISKVYFLDLAKNPNFFQILIGILKLKNILRKEKIDILETSSESISILGMLSCLGTKTYHVLGIHKTYNRKRGHFNKIRELTFLFLTKLRKRNYFYAVSNWTKKEWVDFSKTRERKIKVIFNSCDFDFRIKNIEKFKKNFFLKYDIPLNSKLVLSVGRICYHKRQDFILDSLGPILKKKNIYLIFVGEYDLDEIYPENKGTLEKINHLIKKFDINSNVRFLGFRNDVREIMSISELLVHATITEAFGLVLLEAMSLGLPIISTRVEAIPEIVPEPDNFLVELNDLESFKKYVSLILERTNKTKKEVSKRNIKFAKKKKFNRRERTKQMFNYFQQIIDNEIN